MSSLVQSSLGIGYAVLYMTIVPYFIEYKLALAMMFLQYIVVLAFALMSMREKMNFRMALPCIIGNTVGIAAGILLLTSIDAGFVVKLLGVVLILSALYFFMVQGRWRLKPTFSKGLGLGGFSGILAGLFGIGGPPLSIYLINATDDLREYLATIQLTYVLGTVVGLFLHAAVGHYPPVVAGATLISFVPVFAGCLLSFWLLKRLDKRKFSKFLYSFMVLMGLVLVVK